MKSEEKNMEIKILDAAEKLFLEQGFSKTTTGQIAKSAGCNQALVHYYYRTKDNLFEKIFEKKALFLIDNLLNVSTTGTSFEDKLQKMIEFHFNFLMDNPKLLPFLYIEVSSNPERIKPLIKKIREHLVRNNLAKLEADLQVEIEHGRIRNISSIQLLLSVVSLNAFPFFLKLLAEVTLDLPEEFINVTLQERKKEVIATILSRLKP